MRLKFFVVFVSGCASVGPGRPYPIHVRGLFPNQRTERLEPGVAVIADGVTASNWLEDHRDLLKHLTWTDSTGSTGAREGGVGGPGGNMSGVTSAAAASAELRFD